MNLVNVVDEEGLKQDEWSLTRPKFGKEGQLEVVGWEGKQYTSKLYILRCAVCSKDPELFGQGYFTCQKVGLTSQGQIPCGCSKKPSWSKEQYGILCSRKAEQLGYTFLGFVGDWRGNTTKIRVSCPAHGEWTTGTVSSLISIGNGCRACGVEYSTGKAAVAKLKPDEIMIASFMDTGAFHLDTKFWRSERKTNTNSKVYWYVSCPECGEQGESTSANLQKGKRSCACSPMRQKECYINLILDEATCIAVKFGIARDSAVRALSQNKKSVFDIKSYAVYQFVDVNSCKSAERECKELLSCGVVLKRDMPDGYTETTHAYNLDKIKQIYKKHGGIEVCHSP